MFPPFKASRILLTGDHSERNELIEVEGNFSDDSACDRYLAHAAEVFASECMKGIMMFLEFFLVAACNVNQESFFLQLMKVFFFPVDGALSDLSRVEVLKEPYFSRKLLRLIGILSSFRLVFKYLFLLL